MNSSKEDKPAGKSKGVCPKCESARLPGDYEANCSFCGAISCPKCASLRIVDAKVNSWDPPAQRCQICGWRKEQPMTAAKMRVTEVEKSPAFRDCATPGCDTRVSARSEYDTCKKCRGRARAQQQKEAIERRLEKLGVAA